MSRGPWFVRPQVCFSSVLASVVVLKEFCASSVGSAIKKSKPRTGSDKWSIPMKGQPMKTTSRMLVLFCLMAGVLMAQEPKVTPLMSKTMPNLPGKEGLMLLVEYPPGGADPIHRHNAHAFVYVLEGSVIMQVKGGKEVTLTPGQTFYEGRNDIHTVGRNASKTQPAKFVVFLVKEEGAPALIPVK